MFVVLFAAACPKAEEERACPALDELCPTLACVEHARRADGCALCECSRQACLVTADCREGSGADAVCSTGVDVCEPAPACTDDDADTLCPAACFGRCVQPAALSDDRCRDSSGCSDGGECRSVDGVCLGDPAAPGECLGFCASGCAEVETIAADPVTGLCVRFPDSCVPRGFILGC